MISAIRLEPDTMIVDTMIVTVCELPDQLDDFVDQWQRLVAHVASESSQLVLLPEMPFAPWLAATRDADPAAWEGAVAAHDTWQQRLEELGPAVVLGSRPVIRDDRRLNEGFVWDREHGYRAVHHKYYLPDETGFWEASWYSPGDGRFDPVACAGTPIGFLICTELWSMEPARRYGKQGVQIIATPRATEHATSDKWLVGGRAAAVVAGAFSISSNRSSSADDPVHFGGQGWIVDPDGAVLALTSRDQPIVTVEIDLAVAERARQTYPRYVY